MDPGPQIPISERTETTTERLWSSTVLRFLETMGQNFSIQEVQANSRMRNET